MNRREFLNRSTAATLSLGLSNYLLGESPLDESVHARSGASDAVAGAIAGAELPQTAPLTEQDDLAMRMVDGIRNYLLRETGRQAAERERLWSRDFLSADRYMQSVEPNRQRFRQIIGAVDPRTAVQPPEVMVRFAERAEIAQGTGYKAYPIRWRVFEPVTADSDGMQAEGLLLQPQQPPVARVVALPDADWTPEMLIGITDGVPPAAQFARRLAENGIQVVVPVLMNRDDTFSGIPGIGMTNMPHREWIYRMAFETGRHIIGYEVQKVLAVVDWFERENSEQQTADRSHGLWRGRTAGPVQWRDRYQDRCNGGQRVFPAARSSSGRSRSTAIFGDWSVNSAMRNSPVSSLPAASSLRRAAAPRSLVRRRPQTGVRLSPVRTGL